MDGLPDIVIETGGAKIAEASQTNGFHKQGEKQQ